MRRHPIAASIACAVLLASLALPALAATVSSTNPPKEYEDLWQEIFTDAATVQLYFDDTAKDNFPLIDDVSKGLSLFASIVIANAHNKTDAAPGESRTRGDVINDWMALCLREDDSMKNWQQALKLDKQVMAKNFDTNPDFDYKGALANGNASLALADMYGYVLGRRPIENGYAEGNPCLIAAADAFISDGAPDNGQMYEYFGGKLTSLYKDGDCFYTNSVPTCQPALKLTWTGTPDSDSAKTILNSAAKANDLIQQYTDTLNKPQATTQPVTTPQTRGGQILSGSPLSLTLPLGSVSLPAVIARVIRQLLSIVGALALAFFVWGGVRWMLARGAPEEVAKAKKMIVAAISGLVAIFASYAILSLIINAVSK